MKCFALLAVMGILLCRVEARSEPECNDDGVIYQVGDRIPSDDPCTTCFCGPVGARQCHTIYCDLPSCGRSLEPVAREGECCPSCRCVSNGTTYDIGENIPNTDPCKSCKCTEARETCATKLCSIPECRDGLRPVTKEGECCPSCSCVVNGTAYNIGEDIPNDDPCKTCTCTGKGVICARIHCAIPECGLYPAITKEGLCCPVCPDCPPSCSSSYCTSNPNAVCTLPAEDFCFNRLSSCRACYYGATEKKAPKKCKRFVKRKSARTPAKAEKRVKKWGKCVERVYDEESEGTGNFMCIRYPTKL